MVTDGDQVRLLVTGKFETKSSLRLSCLCGKFGLLGNRKDATDAERFNSFSA